MTSIVSWFNREGNGTVWVVGDSKITDGGTNPSMLLDSGAKIFSIPLICKQPSTRGFFEDTYLQSKVGLAYAGSSLIGLNVQAAISTVFSNLNGMGLPPSMSELGEYTRMIAKNYIDTLAIIKQEAALCEFLLMGYCHKTALYKICKIKPDFSSGSFDMTLDVYDSQSANGNAIFILGDKKSDIENLIVNYRASLQEKNILWDRAPQAVLKEIIKEDTYSTIGGHLQQGFCMGTDFIPVSTCVYIEGQKPKAYLSYLGFDVTGDASRVGDCMVGITGMV
ncbi:hypothetical protein [Endozoicomonas sp.]|uniref:hypothetical protein n=1 Tax=Endozoicomonas sp. TaxID=1892382 RepID=UPI00383A1FED